MLREQGQRGNRKVGDRTAHGKRQQKGTGLETDRHGEGADKEGGT